MTHLRVSLHHAYSFSSLDKHLAAERERLAALHGDDVAGEDDLGVGDEEETQELLKADPKEWKVLFYNFHVHFALSLNSFNSQKQDQYAVLGLSHLRYKATPEQIKVARTLFLPRVAILNFHPFYRSQESFKASS